MRTVENLNYKSVEAFLSKVLIKKKSFELDYARCILYILASIMTIFISYLLLFKHYTFNTFAWDLGTFAQILHSILEDKSFYHTPYLFVIPDGDYLKLHFSPILLLIAPIYALYPRAETLLLLKSIFTIFASLPLYELSFKLLNNRLKALAISVVYMFYPPLHGALWFDFQPQAFIPLFTFMTEYAYVARRKLLYTSSIILLALTSEHGALLALIMALIHLFAFIKEEKKQTSSFLRKSMCYIMITIIIATYFTITTMYLEYQQEHNVMPEFREFLRAYSNWQILGYKGSTFLMPFYIFTHPWKTFEALLYDYHIKFLNIMLTYGILGFTPLFSVYGLLSLAIQIPFLLSNYKAYYTLGAHYPYYYIGFVFLGFVYALRRAHLNRVKWIIILTIFSLVSTAPWSPLSMAFVKETGIFWYPVMRQVNDDVITLHKLIEIANAQHSSLLTMNHIFPHTSLGSNVYAIPFQEIYYYNVTFIKRYLNGLISKSDLILLDLRSLDDSSKYVLNTALNNNFKIYALGTNAVLLKRNYLGEPVYGKEFLSERIFNVDSFFMKPPAKVIATDSGKAITFPKGVEGYVAYGPYTYLVKGTYVVTYHVKVRNVEGEGPLLLVDVASDKGQRILASKVIDCAELRSSVLKSEYVNVSLHLKVSEELLPEVEFRVYSFSLADIEFYRVEVRRVNESAESTVGDMSFTNDRLIFVKDAVARGKFMELNTTGSIAKLPLFWYGPYISIPKGLYSVEIYMKITPTPISDDILFKIDVAHKRGTAIVKAVNVTRHDLTPLQGGWYVIKFELPLNEDVNDLEIRCLEVSPGYVFSFSHINLLIGGVNS